jgi:hypothetical protein
MSPGSGSRFYHLKGQCHKIFPSGFFHESVYPQPKGIPLGLFQIFSKICGDILKSRCTTGINTAVANLPPVSMTLAAKLHVSINDTSTNLPPLSTGLEKTRVFFKNPAQWVFLGFLGFLGFFGFFAQMRGFLGVFQFHKYF